MIHAESVKAVQELLKEHGIDQREGERWGDYVARGLNISDAQAEAFLEALDQNRSISEACQMAGIPAERHEDTMLGAVAQTIGRALGRASRALS